MARKLRDGYVEFISMHSRSSRETGGAMLGGLDESSLPDSVQELSYTEVYKLHQSMGDYETGQKFMPAIIHAAKLEKTLVIETKALMNRHKAMWIPRESGVSMQ